MPRAKMQAAPAAQEEAAHSPLQYDVRIYPSVSFTLSNEQSATPLYFQWMQRIVV